MQVKYHFRSIFAVFGIYGLWVAISWGIYGIAGLLPHSFQVHPIISSVVFPLTAFLFVLFGCHLNALFFVYAEPEFQKNPVIRWLVLAVVIAAGALMVMLGVRGTFESPVFFMIHTANLIVFANLLGSWLIKPLKREAELILVCVVMALADLFSVIRGPTRHVVESIKTYYESGMPGPPPLVDFLLVKIPVFGLDHLQPVFGVSDWIIIVFLSAAAARFKVSDNLAGKGLFKMAEEKRMAFYLPVAGAGLAIAIFIADQLHRFIPALPVISVLYGGFLLVRYPAARQLTRSDWRVLIVFAGVMLGLLFFAWFIAR